MKNSSDSVSRSYQGKTAFLLNANARSVNQDRRDQLEDLLPESDLFFSRSLEEAEEICALIARRGYSKVFTGGGDGTFVSAVAFLKKACADQNRAMPRLGVLRLGTGNALATHLGAGHPIDDAFHMTQDGSHEDHILDLVETEGGAVSPFAGIGYDGAVLNDYIRLKEKIQSPWLKALVTTAFGYLIAVFCCTAPRLMRRNSPVLRIKSVKDAYRMVHENGVDKEVRIPAGSTLYEGTAGCVSVGSIPFFGAAFRMFPFATRKAGFIQLRVCNAPIYKILLNLFPGVWTGKYRGPDLHDFLVEDVEIESSDQMDFQIGGDACGERQKLRFRTSPMPVHMVRLNGTRHRAPRPINVVRGLLPAFKAQS
jgi:diacylglycerol kinase family enzyme